MMDSELSSSCLGKGGGLTSEAQTSLLKDKDMSNKISRGDDREKNFHRTMRPDAVTGSRKGLS